MIYNYDTLKENHGRAGTKKLFEMNNIKTCVRCDGELPATKEFFYGDAHKKDGLSATCKKCNKASLPSKNPRKVNAGVGAESFESRRVKRELINFAMDRAADKNRDFNITTKDVHIPLFCPILGIPIDTSRKGNGKATDSSPSIDRINSDKGYVLGNIQVISYRANTLKSNATIEELRKILKYLENNR